MSRHIRRIEDHLGVSLFLRVGRGIVLTNAGEQYLSAVRSSIDILRAARVRIHSQRQDLVIGCSLDASELVMLPVFPDLMHRLGGGIAARVVTYDYDLPAELRPAGLDVVFEVAKGDHPDAMAVKILDEAIVPVAAPALLERYPLLTEAPVHWNGVPRLDAAPWAPGWATWDTWFRARGCAVPKAPIEIFENYIYLLRAATQGDGMAIGWNGFMADYVDQGRLVALRPDWLETRLSMYAVPTPAGKLNPATHALLEHLPQLVAGLCTERPPIGSSPDARHLRAI